MNKNSSNIFDDIGLSILDVSDLMEIMNISHTELTNVEKLQKFKYIAQFVKDIPNKDRFFTRIPLKYGEDKVDFFYNYCRLRTEYEEFLRRKEENDSLLFKSPDDEILREQQEIIDSEIRDLESTIQSYEN